MFSSPEAALRFAFRMRDKSIISSPSGVFLAKEKHKNPNATQLTVWDFHAQAGMVFGFVGRLELLEQAWVYLNYGNALEAKICARLMSAQVVKDPEVARFQKTPSEIRRALLSRTVRSCAKTLAISPSKAFRLRRAVGSAMQPLQYKVLDKLWEHLCR